MCCLHMYNKRPPSHSSNPNSSSETPLTVFRLYSFSSHSCRNLNSRGLFLCGRNGRLQRYGPMARSQFAVGRSCYRPTRSRFSVVSLRPRENPNFVPRFQVALHASQAALPMVTSKFRPNVALPKLHQNFTIKKPFQHIYIN
jgi:hypothetical protein